MRPVSVTEFFLTLLADYGLILLFAIMVVACLGVPLPSSFLVLTCGAFAGAGDFALLHVILVTLLAYLMGDQLAFWLGRRAGTPLITFARARPRLAPLVQRGQGLLDRRGQAAVFLSHTIISPLGPYVTYLCGASALTWRRFLLPASIGALVWTCAYAGLGFVFATQLTQLMSLMGNFAYLALGLIVLGALGLQLYRAWLAHKARAGK